MAYYRNEITLNRRNKKSCNGQKPIREKPPKIFDCLKGCQKHLQRFKHNTINSMRNLLFGLIATIMFSVNGFAKNNFNESIIKKQITSYSIDGNLFTPKEFSQLDSKVLEIAKACTVTVTVTVQTPAGPQTFTTTETFEASWLGCLAAKVGAFLATLWEPSI